MIPARRPFPFTATHCAGGALIKPEVGEYPRHLGEAKMCNLFLSSSLSPSFFNRSTTNGRVGAQCIIRSPRSCTTPYFCVGAKKTRESENEQINFTGEQGRDVIGVLVFMSTDPISSLQECFTAAPSHTNKRMWT